MDDLISRSKVAGLFRMLADIATIHQHIVGDALQLPDGPNADVQLRRVLATLEVGERDMVASLRNAARILEPAANDISPVDRAERS